MGRLPLGAAVSVYDKAEVIEALHQLGLARAELARREVELCLAAGWRRCRDHRSLKCWTKGDAHRSRSSAASLAEWEAAQ